MFTMQPLDQMGIFVNALKNVGTYENINVNYY